MGRVAGRIFYVARKERLHADSGEVLEYETLLIATGARARKLDCPGNDLPNGFQQDPSTAGECDV
jgi:thioredoxin reductase